MTQIKDFPDYEIQFHHETEQPMIWSNKSKKYLKIQNRKGYCSVQLGRGNNKDIHKLIAEHYIQNPNNLTDVDHINGNPSDNRIENLRWTTRSQNNHNRKNAKGYYWDKSRNKWKAQIAVNGKHKNLGRFDTEEEARAAYLKASEEHYPGILNISDKK